MTRKKYRFWITKEQLSILLKGILSGGVLVFLFYDSFIGIPFLLPYLPVYYKREREKQQEKEKQELKKEFEQVIKLITKGLEIGYSLEHCIESAKVEYEEMLSNQTSPMIRELETFVKKLQMNVPVQQIFEEFAMESQIEEVKNFAQIIEIARKTGGNLPAILRRTTEVMLEKEQVYEEILTMMSAKKMEQKVMTFMPVGILAYMRFTSNGYMEPLYHNPIGILIATIGLVLMAVSILWAQKIVTITI